MENESLENKSLKLIDIVRRENEENLHLSARKLAKYIKERYRLDSSLDSIRVTINRVRKGNQGEETIKSDKGVSVHKDDTQEEEFEERSIGEEVRDRDGNITHYHYHIEKRDERPIKGTFTREEMNTIYRLYSNNEGANLNRRSVSREFPNITFRDFKRILRAFNITKDSIPVAPHVLEENDPNKTASIIRQNKENVVLKKLDQDRSKHFEVLWRKTLKSYVELKENREFGVEYLQDLIEMEKEGLSPLYVKPQNIDNDVCINIYLADIHLGAETLKDSLFKNPWNEEEAIKCVQQIVTRLVLHAEPYKRFHTINLVHLGDGVDGMNNSTTRSGSHHFLPQNMNNKEQIRTWIKLMKMTIDAIHKLDLANNINFYTTTDDNHSGDFLYGAYLALEEFCKWKYPDMTYELFEQFIGHFDCGMHTFVCTHGKDKMHMKSGMPLTLNEKTENFIIDYLETREIFHPNVHFVKGDLHQSARQSGGRFDYKNVFSTYGASAWIHHNFGVGQPGVDYDIFWYDRDIILEGRIKFKRGSRWDR